MKLAKNEYRILCFLLSSGQKEHFGVEISSATGLSPAGIYTQFRRMMKKGLLVSRREVVPGQPAKVFYSPSGLGQKAFEYEELRRAGGEVGYVG